jgi:hypothetical protein
MKFAVLLCSLVASGAWASSSQPISPVVEVPNGNTVLNEIVLQQAYMQPLQMMRVMAMAKAGDGLFDWKVGDTLNFDMQMKPLPQKGTMTIKVVSDTADGYTLEEDVNFLVLKQVVQVLFDKNTGEIKKMTVNGKETDVPDAGKETLVKEEEAHITVPAGSFDCIHMVTEDASHQQSETWLNPRDLPITGILKTKAAEAGVLEVNTELVSFARGQ